MSRFVGSIIAIGVTLIFLITGGALCFVWTEDSRRLEKMEVGQWYYVSPWDKSTYQHRSAEIRYLVDRCRSELLFRSDKQDSRYDVIGIRDVIGKANGYQPKESER